MKGKYKQFNDINNVKKNAVILIIISLVLMCTVCLFAMQKVVNANKTAKANAFLLHKGSKVPLEPVDDPKRTVAIMVEGHLTKYHDLFFDLEPNLAFIKSRIVGEALHMVDDSGDRFYYRLVEEDFYEDVALRGYRYLFDTDSISVDYSKYPFHFRLYGTQTIKKGTQNFYRRMETTGEITETGVTPKNTSGLEIRGWNVDVNEPKRKGNGN